MQVIKRAEGQLSSTYALMVANGILPSDYLSAKNKESTASVEQYAGRVEAAGMICYTKTERAELATKLLKTVRRGLTTAHKLAAPDEYKAGGANEPKTAIEDLAALMEKATKLLQGDKPFPETFAHDDAIAVLKGFVKTFC